MKFFRYFPIISYTFENANAEFQLLLTNPTAKVVLVERLKQHITAYYDYVVQDGDRPDSVATKVYGSPDYTWIVLILNGMQSLYDWPLTYDEFNDYIIDAYGSVATAQATPVYKTTEGFIVDATSYAELPVARRGVVSNVYDEEATKNEAKRTIKLIPSQFVMPLLQELRNAFNG